MQTSTMTDKTLGRRIAVVGCPGAGKSTLAMQIAERTGKTYIKADEIFWMPNWVQRPRPEYNRLVSEALSGDDWVYDGNIGRNREIVLPRIDTLIWIDHPKRVVMARLLRRTIRRAWTKEPIFHNNSESWRMSFASKDSIFLYGWQNFGVYRERYSQMYNGLPEHVTHSVRIGSPVQAEVFLDSL